MAQVKKEEVREAILVAAFKLFSRKGYTDTTLTQIAAGAGVSTANVYVYFKSKLDILYAIYAPWLRARLAALEAELAEIREPYARLHRLLSVLWREIPADERGFANNIMQALATVKAGDKYRPTLLHWMEHHLTEMVLAALPPKRRALVAQAPFAHLLVMAFDGFILYRHVNPARPCDESTIDLVCRLLLGRV